MQLFRRHPKALPFLFLTEMWERFGFYIVQGMLVLYASQQLGFSDDESYTLSGSFTALVYIAPILGGALADKVLGFKRAILWGGVFLSMGYALLSFSWAAGFYIALATIIVGNGLFKPNISSLLGTLYTPQDTARDAGFTLFYVGINSGILLAGISSGLIKNHFGWHASFAAASVGLLVGLGIFILGIVRGDIPSQPTFSVIEKKRFLTKPWLILYCLFTIGVLSFFLKSNLVSQWLLPIIGIGLLFFIFMMVFKQDAMHRKNMFTLNILILASVIYWTFYLQMFFSINFFIERLVHKQMMGISIPTTVFYSLESIFVILLGPVCAWFWQRLHETAVNPSPYIKFVIAIFLVGIAFLILALGTYFTPANEQVNLIWVVFSYLLISIGELLLSPIGLSTITLLAPTHMAGLMMGVWFVALGFGGGLGGWLAELASVPAGVDSRVTQLLIYQSAFLDYALFAFAIAAALGISWLVARKFMFNKQELEQNLTTT